MKRLLKWALDLAAILAVLIVAAFLVKDSLLRTVLDRRIRSRTGMDAVIGTFSSSTLPPAVTIRNLKLFNTAGFGGTLFLDAPELHVEFDPAALSRRELLITLMRLNLSEINVVKNEAGQTNVFAIRNEIQARAGGEPAAQELFRHYRVAGIRVLNLSVGKARFIDLKDSRNNFERDLKLQEQVLQNVNSESDVYGVLFLLWLRSQGSP